MTIDDYLILNKQRIHLAGNRGGGIIWGVKSVSSWIVIIRSLVSIGTVGRVVFAGDGIAHCLARNILDQQPARKQQREINDGK
jgi:hypothetical protein